MDVCIDLYALIWTTGSRFRPPLKAKLLKTKLLANSWKFILCTKTKLED